MIETQDVEKMRVLVQEFFQKTTFVVDIDIPISNDDTLSIMVKTEEPKMLIGQSGQTLAEIQYLLKAILRRHISNPFYINFDINNYKEKKTTYLKETARSLADEVVLTKKEKMLDPMPAYERRIVHLELTEREGILVQSVGEDPKRRIVIKPSL